MRVGRLMGWGRREGKGKWEIGNGKLFKWNGG